MAARRTPVSHGSSRAPASPSGRGAAAAGPPILARLGERVRRRRKDLALTLRELGELCGVSERFLVLLEGGRANVSVVRLEDVARALGTSAAALLAAGGEGEEAPAGRGRIVALLGLRGAGKSTVGARAAGRLDLPFVELDALVAARAGMSLGAIFEMHGDAYYRRLEREELERLTAAGTAAVVATGGSLVTDHATYDLLRRRAITIWLRATPEDHWGRVVEQGDARPMTGRADAMDELRALLRARRPLYERADFVVDTSALGLSRAVDRVVKIAREAASRDAARPG
jgi:XRE family aerobic/anaerobic benzoate catabolism transcriptional regulator